MHPSVTVVRLSQKGPIALASLRVGENAGDSNLSLEAVIHLVLERMRRHAKARDFLHLELDVGVERVVAEYATAREELAIPIEACKRLVERRARVRHLRRFL